MDSKKRKKSQALTDPAAPSSLRRRRRHHRSRRCEDNVDERRDWASLPGDVLCMVLGRLRRQSADILRGAGLACSHWRRVAREEPLLWRHIDLSDGRPWHWRPAGWKSMARVAVDCSAGRCESFIGHVDADVLLHLDNSAPLLTQLSVAGWPYDIPDVTEIVVNKLPLLKRITLWSDELQEEMLLILPMCEGWEEPVRTRIRSGNIQDLLVAQRNVGTSAYSHEVALASIRTDWKGFVASSCPY